MLSRRQDVDQALILLQKPFPDKAPGLMSGSNSAIVRPLISVRVRIRAVGFLSPMSKPVLRAFRAVTGITPSDLGPTSEKSMMGSCCPGSWKALSELARSSRLKARATRAVISMCFSKLPKA
jgi:hypothetical protein